MRIEKWQAFVSADRPCCANMFGDSSGESSMVAVVHGQSGPNQYQGLELIGLLSQLDPMRIAIDLF